MARQELNPRAFAVLAALSIPTLAWLSHSEPVPSLESNSLPARVPSLKSEQTRGAGKETIERIIGDAKSWNELGSVLWRSGDARSLACLNRFLDCTDWNRAKAVADGVLQSFDPKADLKEAQAEVIKHAREIRDLQLSGSLDINWYSGLSFGVSINEGCPDRQTEITLTPTITALNADMTENPSQFSHTYKPITVFSGPKEGASNLVETFSDPNIVKGYGLYKITLLVEATARDQDMEGTTVTRIRSHLVNFQPNHKDIPQSFTQADRDFIDASDLVQDRISEAKPPKGSDIIEHPLVSKPFPMLSVQDSSGKVVVLDSKFWSTEKFTVIKASFVGCPPCIRAEPTLEEIDALSDVRGLTLVFQTREPNLEQVVAGHEKELKGKHFKHPVYVAENSKLEGLDIKGFPTYFVVNSAGVVVGVASGGTFYPQQLQKMTVN